MDFKNRMDIRKPVCYTLQKNQRYNVTSHVKMNGNVWTLDKPFCHLFKKNLRYDVTLDVRTNANVNVVKTFVANHNVLA